MKSFSQQLVHDLKVSWQKTLVLGLLLLVGLYFWIPPLYRAMRGSTAPQLTPAKVNPTPIPQRPPVETEMSFTQTDSKETTLHSWEQFDSLMHTDPLVQSVQMGAVQKNPFEVNRDQFSPPILFAEEPVDTEPVAEKKEPEIKTLPDEIVLTTTIIGKYRKAAMINKKLYYEGKTLQYDNVSYVLERVADRSVILRQGEQTFELKIQNDPSAFIKFE
ncbi:hypothetical protein [Gimesia panareensis]|uniref:hypothetical protein n=1 Tax=Gimesia panareensis TaxID=2527978 RepID=UPI00118A8B5B|nr:hypothetical protein [Gimesia panareensis]QDU53811.1 hypothetical protein Pan110_62050 [Gimesia panareensis]